VKRLATLVAVTATLLAPATPALAQSALLFSGGLNRASIAVTGGEYALLEYLEPVTRMSAGLAVEIPLSEGWNIELGGSYSQKGYAIDDNPELGGSGSGAIDYLEVTALASKPFPLGDRASVSLLAGPALALQVSCQTTTSFADSEETEDCGTDDGPRDTDLGLAGEVRLRMGLSEKVGVTVGALYTLGLQNLSEDEDVDDDFSITSRVLTLGVGLAYAIR